jgi:TPP-dependent indolepyruvate ferredoxin oxidoreductase alpha subunit
MEALRRRSRQTGHPEAGLCPSPAPAENHPFSFQSTRQVKILEELDDVAENQIKAMAFDQQATGQDHR